MTETAIETPNAAPSGIGGWLILPLLGLIFSIIRGVVDAFSLGETIDLMANLTTAQTTLIIAEIVGNLVITILIPAYLLVLMFKKKRAFPVMYVRWAVLDLIFVFADLVGAWFAFRDIYAAGGEEFLDPDTIREIGRSIVLVLIWVPYMLKSRRVANTFIQ